MSYESQPASSSQEHRHPGRMILQLLWIIADVSPTVLMSGPGQTRHFDRAPILPVFSNKRTYSEFVGMSQTCQQRSSTRCPISGIHRISGSDGSRVDGAIYKAA
jgi:hypothetical protein